MENINGKSRASFRWVLSCATIGLVVSISPCFAQGNRDATQETQRLGTALPEITPFKCDSLDPKVCFDIYWRPHNEPAQAEGRFGAAVSLVICLSGSSMRKRPSPGTRADIGHGAQARR
jgi:hypothetical protein